MESGGFDYHIVFHSIPFLGKGMVLTLVLTVLGIGGGLVFGTLLALTVLMGGLFGMVPGGFVPEEDQGYFLVNVQLPDASSLERTQVPEGLDDPQRRAREDRLLEALVVDVALQRDPART